jgi:hypothetical protein
MITKTLTAAAATAALALAGCGGGGDDNKALSYSAFGKKAETICKDAEDQNKALGKTTTGEATPENAALIGKLRDIVQTQKDKLAALKAPDQLKAAQDEFIKVTDQQLTITKKLQAAGDAKDQAGYIAAAREVQALQPQQQAAGSQLGAPSCAS